MTALQISEPEADAAVARLTAGRAALLSPAIVPNGHLPGANLLAAALRSAATVSGTLVDGAVEATTLGALAITNAVLDANDADR